MSMLESNSKELKFTLVKLSDTDCQNSVSYIRNIKPDYLLEISGLNISCDLCSEDDSKKTKISFPEPLDCSFLLNYGDLFLYALNSIEHREFLDTWVTSLFVETMQRRTACNELVFRTLNGNRSSKFTNDILKANADYKQSFSSLSFHAFISLVLFEDKKLDGLFCAAMQNLLTNAPAIEYGALSSEQLQRNLNQNNLFSEITMTIRYRENGMEEYTFKSLFDLIGFEVRQLKGGNCCIKVCENCGRLFIPANRVDEKYCYFPFSGNKTCKQSAFSARLEKDEALKAYRKIYKTQNARKHRNAHRTGIEERFNSWANYAKGRLEECRNGEISLETMIEDISTSSWMSEN